MPTKAVFLDTNGWLALVMQEMGVTEAFTNDRHFEQAGFQCLLPIL